MGLLNRLAFWRSSDKGSVSTWTAEMVEWEETIERDYTVVRERFVWSGGAERIVEYCPRNSMHNTLKDIDGYTVLEVSEQPAYTEVLDSEDVTVEVERSRSAYVFGGAYPPGTEATGDKREIQELAGD